MPGNGNNILDRLNYPGPEIEIKMVKYIGGSIEQRTFAGCKDPEDWLAVGAEYEVANIDVHNCHTKVFLQGFPDKGFNSVCFEEVE